MVVAVKKSQIAYMATPKAACSSVKIALLQLMQGGGVPDLQDLHQMLPTMRFRQHRFRLYRDYWWFCVVRDPIRRLMSVYTDIVVGRKLLLTSPNLTTKDLGLAVSPDPDAFFQELGRYARHASVIKHHCLPAHVFTGPDLSVYDRVYTTAELPQLGADLRQISHKTANVPNANKSAGTLNFEDLNAVTQARLIPYLKREYAYLSAYYDDPFT